MNAASLKPAIIKFFRSWFPLTQKAAVMLDKRKKIKTSKLPENARLVNNERMSAKNRAISNPRNRQVIIAADGIGIIMKKDIDDRSQAIPGLAD